MIALVETEPDLFVLGADRHPVVRHHLRRSRRDRGLERLQVIVEVVCRDRPVRDPMEKCGSSPSFWGPPPGKCFVIVETESAPKRRV